ncbi:hypothetical protein TMEN_9720 [Trichophyton mentagrophytes]|nr:hypothetical protein TMEN_9720 [Trichophyton mentagrophytes]
MEMIKSELNIDEGESTYSESDIDSDTIAEILRLPKTHCRVGKHGNKGSPDASRHALPGVAGKSENPTLTLPPGIYNEKLFMLARKKGFDFMEKDGTRTIKCDGFSRLLVYSQTREAGLFTCVPNINRIYRTNKDHPGRCQLAIETTIVKREILREICTLERRALRRAAFGLQDAYESDSDVDYYGFNRLHVRPRPTRNVEPEPGDDKAPS